MIAAQPIVDRLRARIGDYVPVVEPGELLDGPPTTTPAVYVVCERVATVGEPDLGGVLQLREAVVLVTIYVRSAATPRTQARGREQLPMLCALVDSALLGWTPPGCEEALAHVTTDVVAVGPHELAAQMRYRTRYSVADLDYA